MYINNTDGNFLIYVFCTHISNNCWSLLQRMCFKLIFKKWNTLLRIFNFHFTYFHIVYYFILSDFIVFVPEMLTGMLIFCVKVCLLLF